MNKRIVRKKVYCCFLKKKKKVYCLKFWIVIDYDLKFL